MLFRYHPTRAGSVAAEILGNFRGYLQTDGYSGYEALGEQEGIRHLGCMAHVRRKFIEVEKTAGKKAAGGTAHAALDLIGKLYGVEHQAEKQKLVADKSLPCEPKNPARSWISSRRCSMPASLPRRPRAFSAGPSAMPSNIETAKANGLEPYRYLRHLFEHLPAATTNAQRKALLPQYIDPKSLIIPA